MSYIQARCRTTGDTVPVTGNMTREEAEAWRPSDQDKVKYKYFRINNELQRTISENREGRAGV